MAGMDQDNAIQVKLLERWFSDRLNGCNINLNKDHIQEFITNELQLDLNGLESQLSTIIPYLLVHYLNSWPEWPVGEGTSTIHDNSLIQKLRTYIREKIRFVIEEGYHRAMDEILHDTSNHLDGDSTFSPYAIKIKCPASMLNTIFFTEHNNDIIIKEHSAKQWKQLNDSQFIHWPFLEIRFEGADLSFTRKQATEYIRYLNSTPHQYTVPDKNIVESVEIIDEAVKRTCFTNIFLEAYINHYLEALKTFEVITEEAFGMVEIILNNFIQDIKVINLKETIATNTKIVFKTCPFKYVRVKKLHKLNSTENSRVGYCEIQVPKIELCLNSFTAIEYGDTFELFRDVCMQQAAPANLLPKITYTCTFCKENFPGDDGKARAMEHFEKHHKMEQPVRCSMCKMQFEVTELTNDRWSHNCVISL